MKSTLKFMLVTATASAVIAAGCLFPGSSGSSSVTVASSSVPDDASWDYYPQSDVYYSSNRSAYYYHDNGNWVYSRESPTHLHGSLGSSISVSYVGSRPYDHHSEHRLGHGPVSLSGSATVTLTTVPADATWDFYPESDVYYSSNRSAYYYHDGGNWVYSQSAPSHLHGSLGSSISVSYVGARPYDQHQEHKKGHGKDKDKRGKGNR